MNVKLMRVLKFTEEADQLVFGIVQKTVRDIKTAYSEKNFDENIFKMFLLDVEQEVKFLAVRLANVRGANVVETCDVRAVFRKFWIELLRKRKTFFIYSVINNDLHFIKDTLKPSKPFLILDAGCGWGKASKWLFDSLNEKPEIVGIDLDVFSLKYGKLLNNDFTFLKAHMSYLPFKPKTFDIILSSNSFHEIEREKRNKTLDEFAFSLKSPGLLYVLDSFACSRISKLIQAILHKIFHNIEVHLHPVEFEEYLKGSSFSAIRKSLLAFSIFKSNGFRSYIARR